MTDLRKSIQCTTTHDRRGKCQHFRELLHSPIDGSKPALFLFTLEHPSSAECSIPVFNRERERANDILQRSCLHRCLTEKTSPHKTQCTSERMKTLE